MPDPMEEVLRLLAELRGEVSRERAEIEGIRKALSGGGPDPPKQLAIPFAPVSPSDQLVTLDQMAAMVRLGRRGLQRYVAKMPAPRLRGKRGRAARWAWADVRPWLEAEFGHQLPEQFPTWIDE